MFPKSLCDHIPPKFLPQPKCITLDPEILYGSHCAQFLFPSGLHSVDCSRIYIGINSIFMRVASKISHHMSKLGTIMVRCSAEVRLHSFATPSFCQQSRSSSSIYSFLPPLTHQEGIHRLFRTVKAIIKITAIRACRRDD